MIDCNFIRFIRFFFFIVQFMPEIMIIQHIKSLRMRATMSLFRRSCCCCCWSIAVSINGNGRTDNDAQHWVSMERGAFTRASSVRFWVIRGTKFDCNSSRLALFVWCFNSVQVNWAIWESVISPHPKINANEYWLNAEVVEQAMRSNGSWMRSRQRRKLFGKMMNAMCVRADDIRQRVQRHVCACTHNRREMCV